MSTAAHTKSRHVEGLDALRALAACLVLFHHAHANAKVKLASKAFDHVGRSGWVGVEIFFALSGFVLFLPWARAHYQGRSPSLSRYAENRARRILPAYHFNLFIVLVFSFPMLMLTDWGRLAILWHIGFVATWPDVAGKSLASALVNPVYWTLSAELLFYCALPLLARLFVGRRWVVAAPALIMLGWLAKQLIIAKWLGTANNLGLHRAAYLFPFVADQFYGGMVVAAVWSELEHRQVQVRAWAQYLALVVGFGGVVLTLYLIRVVVGATAYWEGNGPYGMWPLMTLKPLCSLFTAIAIFGVGWARTPITRVLELRPIVWLGTVSYGIYLWQLPIQRALGKVLPKGMPALEQFWWLMGPGSLLVILFAAISYYFVERPFLVRKQETVPDAKPRSVASAPDPA